jgi:hypothetical protein
MASHHGPSLLPFIITLQPLSKLLSNHGIRLQGRVLEGKGELEGKIEEKKMVWKREWQDESETKAPLKNPKFLKSTLMKINNNINALQFMNLKI